MTTTELTSKIRELKELQLYIKQLEEEADAIKATITSQMELQQTEELIVDIFKVRWTTVKSNRFDTTAFKTTHKDLYQQYIKETTGKRFSIA